MVPYHELWTQPFRENTDPCSLWLGPPYREVFATLRAGVLENAGILILTGDVGTGKTMLAGVLADSLGAEGVRVAKLTYTGFQPDDFRRGVARAFGMRDVADTREGVLVHLDTFLREAYAHHERVLLFIDEAQDLAPTLLGDIEHWVHMGREIGRGKVNVLNALLVGQPDLELALRRREPTGSEDAIRVRARLGRLKGEHIVDYIGFRLRAAGADRELFSRKAIREVRVASGGVPRLINQICDYALLVASQRNERVVSAKIVQDAVREWGLTTAGGAIGGDRRRSPMRPGFRRSIYVVALIVAIGFGTMVYRLVNTTGLGDSQLKNAAKSTAGMPTTMDGMSSSAVDAVAVDPVSATRFPNDYQRESATPLGPQALPRGPLVVREIPRVPETPIAARRVERVKPPLGLAAILGKVQPEGTSNPSVSTTASRSPAAARSRESDDPGAIIEWLLKGDGRGAER